MYFTKGSLNRNRQNQLLLLKNLTSALFKLYDSFTDKLFFIFKLTFIVICISLITLSHLIIYISLNLILLYKFWWITLAKFFSKAGCRAEIFWTKSAVATYLWSAQISFSTIPSVSSTTLPNNGFTRSECCRESPHLPPPPSHNLNESQIFSLLWMNLNQDI